MSASWCLAPFLYTQRNHFTHVPEERKHFIVGSVVGNEKTQVRLVQHGSDTDQTGTTTGHDGNVFPSILAGLAFAVVLIIHAGDGLAQGFDAGSRGILSRGDGDVDVGGTLETAFDVVFDLFDPKDQYTDVKKRSFVYSENPPQAHPGPGLPTAQAPQKTQTRQLSLCTRRHRWRIEKGLGRHGASGLWKKVFSH